MILLKKEGVSIKQHEYEIIGKRWIENRLGRKYLMHHGVKGQKWGRRNGPPYPLKRRGDSRIVGSRTSGVISDALKHGEITLQVNKDKQRRHTLMEHTAGRSYINGDVAYAQRLIDHLSGSGKVFIDKNGKWTHREMVTSSKIIGVHVDPSSGDETQTHKAMIVYAKTGTHIYPRKDGSDD